MKRFIVGILAVLFLSGTAYAGPDYFRLGSSADFYGDIETNTGIDLDSDVGYTISGAMGWKFDNYRAETEIGYKRMEGDWGTAGQGYSFNVDAEADVYYFYSNLFYDHSFKKGLTGYIGVGGGPQLFDPRVGYSYSGCRGRCSGSMYDRDDALDLTFGYQAMLGVMYELPSNKAVSLSVVYGNTVNDPTYADGNITYDPEAIGIRLDAYLF